MQLHLDSLHDDKVKETSSSLTSLFHCSVPQCNEDFYPELIILESPVAFHKTAIFFCPKCNTIYRANGVPYPTTNHDYILMIDDPEVSKPSNLLASS